MGSWAQLLALELRQQSLPGCTLLAAASLRQWPEHWSPLLHRCGLFQDKETHQWAK